MLLVLLGARASTSLLVVGMATSVRCGDMRLVI